MNLSALDLYSIGIGPSSSHTVGPMRAAKMFVESLGVSAARQSNRVIVNLYGSLGATGRGHGSDAAVMLGLEGYDPATIDVVSGRERVDAIRRDRRILLAGVVDLAFNPDTDLVLHGRQSLPRHPNGMTFTVLDAAAAVVCESTYYSVGGGFVVEQVEDDMLAAPERRSEVPLPFTTAAELLGHCRERDLAVSDVMMRNECTWRTEQEVRAGLLKVWSVMQECVSAGLAHEGTLPGGLGVRRRAPDLYRKLSSAKQSGLSPNHLDWLSLFALAVNEENASGGRVVTAPTNGAAGVMPSLLHYYVKFVDSASEDGIVRFLLTGAAVGILVKINASISGAEMGCQGEIGSACSMAAAALCEVLGGTPSQVENAAEMGIEHNLGLTCDPVGGLVQIPCIERNAMASVKALNAAQLSLHGDGTHRVSLDQVITTMRDTGRDMSIKYKETSQGGLAVNVVEC